MASVFGSIKLKMDKPPDKPAVAFEVSGYTSWYDMSEKRTKEKYGLFNIWNTGVRKPVLWYMLASNKLGGLRPCSCF